MFAAPRTLGGAFLRTEWARLDLLHVSQMPNWQIGCNKEKSLGQDDANNTDNLPQRNSFVTQSPAHREAPKSARCRKGPEASPTPTRDRDQTELP